MPKLGQKATDITRERSRLSHLGKITSEETKKKLSLIALGRKFTNEHKIKISKALTGIKRSQESKLKMSYSHKLCYKNGKINAWKDKHLPDYVKKKMSIAVANKPRPWFSGRNNPNWNGGVTEENHKIRNTIEMKLWRKSCLERDNFTCQKNGQYGGKLVVHHINNFSSCRELRTSIENGITLSEKAHKEFHKIYGIKNNTKEQLLEFKTKLIWK
jgi:hypothetical protein